jgi:hypothetical protein
MDPNETFRDQWKTIAAVAGPVISLFGSLLGILLGKKAKESRSKWIIITSCVSLSVFVGLVVWKFSHEKPVPPVPPIQPIQPMTTNFIHVDLPSTFADCSVTVDGKPAEIVDRALTSQTVRVVTTEGQHQFHFQKGSVSRDLPQFLSASQPNVTLSPFSN